MARAETRRRTVPYEPRSRRSGCLVSMGFLPRLLANPKRLQTRTELPFFQSVPKTLGAVRFPSGPP